MAYEIFGDSKSSGGGVAGGTALGGPMPPMVDFDLQRWFNPSAWGELNTSSGKGLVFPNPLDNWQTSIQSSYSYSAYKGPVLIQRAASPHPANGFSTVKTFSQTDLYNYIVTYCKSTPFNSGGSNYVIGLKGAFYFNNKHDGDKVYAYIILSWTSGSSGSSHNHGALLVNMETYSVVGGSLIGAGKSNGVNAGYINPGQFGLRMDGTKLVAEWVNYNQVPYATYIDLENDLPTATWKSAVPKMISSSGYTSSNAYLVPNSITGEVSAALQGDMQYTSTVHAASEPAWVNNRGIALDVRKGSSTLRYTLQTNCNQYDLPLPCSQVAGSGSGGAISSTRPNAWPLSPEHYLTDATLQMSNHDSGSKNYRFTCQKVWLRSDLKEYIRALAIAQLGTDSMLDSF